MDLNIGSNVFRNTNGVLKVEGKEQLVLQIDAEDPQLFVTMDLYDAAGTQLAHLRRNVWRINHHNRFDVERVPSDTSLFTLPMCVTLIDKPTGIVLEVKLMDMQTVYIPHGRFYSHTGQLVEITPHYWRFPGKPTTFGSVCDVRGGAAALG
jgi:hypothetical protein